MFDVNGPLRKTLRRVPLTAVARGLPPSALGYRWVEKAPLNAATAERAGGTYRVLAPAQVESNPLPLTLTAEELPSDRGWWGYSFADVPTRLSGETGLASLPDATLAFARDARQDLHVGLLDANGRALALREVDFRAHHAAPMRGEIARRAGDTVWIAERVYDNHSHWLTAHLPKLCLLRDLGLLDRLVMPEPLTPVIERSLRQFGLDPAAVPRVPVDRATAFERLTLLQTDRFRPDLLRPVRSAFGVPTSGAHRRVYISRAQAGARRLSNEEEIWPIFGEAGFERVVMERLSFDEQLALMAETLVLAGPHGAGLTSQMFCPAGATVIEIADLGFPNPNFYALACAMGHRYAFVRARSMGDGELLFRDLTVDPLLVEQALAAAGL